MRTTRLWPSSRTRRCQRREGGQIRYVRNYAQLLTSQQTTATAPAPRRAGRVQRAVGCRSSCALRVLKYTLVLHDRATGASASAPQIGAPPDARAPRAELAMSGYELVLAGDFSVSLCECEPEARWVVLRFWLHGAFVPLATLSLGAHELNLRHIANSAFADRRYDACADLGVFAPFAPVEALLRVAKTVSGSTHTPLRSQ
mmetsp:Transcript_21831/g.67712  ORF Transcript_21831/g.67712 Transcript_21831/m.67712 type:complete len:201 (-) Transcript_21831:14-616(-)